MHDVMTKLNEKIEEELEKIVKKGDITPSEIENATKAICLMEKIREYEFDNYLESVGDDEGNSMMLPRSYSYRYPNRTYSDYGSRSNRSYTRGSYDRGYSGHSIKDRMVEKLEKMMDETTSDYERSAISEWIGKIENDRR